MDYFLEQLIDQEYEEQLRKLQEKGEVEDEDYENLRSTWIMRKVAHEVDKKIP